MADPSGQDPVTDEPGELEKLENENEELRKQFFIANEIQLEMRQLLANTQFELAATKAKLKLANQATR